MMTVEKRVRYFCTTGDITQYYNEVRIGGVWSEINKWEYPCDAHLLNSLRQTKH